MEISNAHHQAMVSHQLEEVLSGCPNGGQQQQQERKARPQPEQALRCPRCDSTNTKFCYYNNYSLSQPRYFCKACRRYWTQGGSLRNVPVGGGCRKNKRSSSSSSSSSSSKKAQQDQAFTNPNPLLPPPMPPLTYDPSDLTLAFARLHNHPTTPRPLGLDDHHDQMFFLGNPNPNPSNIPTGSGFLDILRGGFLDSTTTTTTTTTPSSFHNFYYGFGGGGAHVEEVGGGGVGGELVLPFEEAASSSQGGPCKAMDGGESKLLMGLQWPLGGEGGMSVDSGREYWNGPSWHGLINSSMM